MFSGFSGKRRDPDFSCLKVERSVSSRFEVSFGDFQQFFTAGPKSSRGLVGVKQFCTLIARGMFCGAKYTHHTFTPIIKHLITTTANKHPGKKSFININIKNPTGIKLCISLKLPLPEDPPLKSYCPNKSNYKYYLQQIN